MCVERKPEEGGGGATWGPHVEPPPRAGAAAVRSRPLGREATRPSPAGRAKMAIFRCQNVKSLKKRALRASRWP